MAVESAICRGLLERDKSSGPRRRTRHVPPFAEERAAYQSMVFFGSLESPENTPASGSEVLNRL